MIIELSSLLVASASLVTAFWFGKKSAELSARSLDQAERIADRSSRDWRQQQWFLLFVEATTAYHLLRFYQAVIERPGGSSTDDVQASHSAAVLQIKKAQALAGVFPDCPEITALQDAVRLMTIMDFRNPAKSAALLEAANGIRLKALVGSDVLGDSSGDFA